ncbi:MAG TPA: peptidoglycan recognition protein, partial [Thermoleophilia bacterium]|nr:peptidoglycan recognition protein [Thermoleophilia bacterium]
MWWRNDKTGHGAARLAALLLLGTIVALAAAWAAPRSSGAVEAWVKSPRDVTLRRVSIRPRLRLGQVDRRDASPAGRLRAARDGGVETIDSGARFTMLGLVCDPPSDDAEVEVRLRTSIDGRVWSRWYAAPLEVAAEDGQAPQAYVDALWTGEGRFVQVCAVAVGDHAPRVLTGVELAALDTEGRSGVVAQAGNVLRRVVATVSAAGLAAPAEAATEAPTWVTRAGWGADESLRKGSPVTAPVKMAFVHHTAGSNEYTRQQAAALVRGIYVYHTTGLGWSDIGYNFLIDRFGTIYVGRAGGPRQGVVGAHVYGFNTGSTGVSVMGTHTSQAPSPAVTDALIRLLAWKLELHGVDPLASIRMTCGASDKYTAGQTVTLPAISGHRDANYTECPGEALYAELGAVRTAVGARIGSRTGAPAPYALTLDLSAAEVVQGAKVTYSGTVKTAAGAAAGGTVTLQRRPAAGGDWSAWRTAKLSATGSWSLAVAMTNAPREWQLRARMPGDGGANLTGLSPV